MVPACERKPRGGERGGPCFDDVLDPVQQHVMARSSTRLARVWTRFFLSLLQVSHIPCKLTPRHALRKHFDQIRFCAIALQRMKRLTFDAQRNADLVLDASGPRRADGGVPLVTLRVSICMFWRNIALVK